MAFDVARVRGLHPTLGDGWVHLDPQAGMLIPDAVSTTVSTAFRTSGAQVLAAIRPVWCWAPIAPGF